MLEHERSLRTTRRRTADPHKRAELSASRNVEAPILAERRADATLSMREKQIARENLIRHMQRHPPVVSGSRRGMIALLFGKAKVAAMALIRGKQR